MDRARTLGLRLLWLTTHEETEADRIYQRLGWTRLGVIPDYATLPDGSLAGNAYYYLRLGASGEAPAGASPERLQG